ncbi:MAG: glycosyltransferase family 9 protein [Candidatus Krumholzibacteria bacterium]|nr:glycosyltransferase family 9 protein [Candidatus Krumholzibacteria bacterium]MDH4336336.1 glycosyltransferase family 9 protein [Candidatus Krumholzibacteria bacterium]MDH5270514.1 glycosyltransferase family 9 protein [Candidatus Krumholzibacteria bacterium]MDH5627746.1 glycosyltransferase family 9 protein [Candidatus Krumholzibacteria bacterium]
MRLVFIRFSSLGDCVLLCPLLAHARRSGAEEVVVLTKRAYAELFAAAEGVDRVIAIERGASAGQLLGIASALRATGHVVVDAHASWRSRVVAWRAGGAAARIEKHTLARLGLIVFKRPAPLPTMLERYAALAGPAGLPAATLRPGGIVLPATAAAAADRALGARDAIAVAPGSRWEGKRWAGFGELCAALAARGHVIVLVGDEQDRVVTAPIAATLGDRALDLAGSAPLLHTAAHIARCRLFVGNDSGLMHLAEAVGVPVVAMFGPTVESFGYFPSLDGSRVVERALACRPCSRNGAVPCPRGTGECLAAIPHQRVLEVVLDALAGAGTARVVLP